MVQIHLSEATDADRIEGKTVDKVSLSRSKERNGNQFIITFKDGTYIALCIGEDTVTGECILKNASPASPVKEVGDGVNVHDGTVYLCDYIKKQKTLGIIDVDENAVKRESERQLEEAVRRKYEEYVRLKEDMENSHTEKND